MRGFRRARLAAVRRKKKGGGFSWSARGWVPVRNADGSYGRRRVERSLEGGTAAARQENLERIAAEYEERAQHTPISFSRAYLNYVEHHPAPIYGDRILEGAGGAEGLGAYQCREINDTMMIALARGLFKPDAKASYINRHLYTPVLAILKMALKGQAPLLTRPKGYKDSPPIVIPDKHWFGLVLPHMSPTTQALVAFLTMHGRRLGDALGRSPKDFDPDEGTLMVGKTKNGDPLLIDLHPRCVELMDAMPGWRKRRWLFGDGPEADSNVRRDILVACIVASGISPAEALEIAEKPTDHMELIRGLSVPYFSPHVLGRHSFATRMLRAGYSLQYVKDAGGWKSIEVLSRLYGHLERKDFVPGVHQVGDTFVAQIGADGGGNVGEASPTERSTFTVNAGESDATT